MLFDLFIKAIGLIKDYRNRILIIISLFMFCLGVYALTGDNVPDILAGRASLALIFMVLSNLSVVLCFIIYYIFLLLKNKHINLLVSISFSLYSIFFLIITHCTYVVTIMIFSICLILLLLSFADFGKSLFLTVLYSVFMIIISCLQLIGLVKSKLVFESSSDDIMVVVVSCVILFVICFYILLDQFHKIYKYEVFLKTKLTDIEYIVIKLRLKGYTLTEIAKIRNKAKSTIATQEATALEKIGVSEVNRVKDKILGQACE